ncbi:hypothetical protein ACTHS0_11740, partial [Neisseria sp. P0013.S009]|uniref:hypothetical protein n=1 Tax=Neisseria sp. P0013.S009 TaxID=3436745 RepID=UPI003F7D1877
CVGGGLVVVVGFGFCLLGVCWGVCLVGWGLCGGWVLWLLGGVVVLFFCLVCGVVVLVVVLVWVVCCVLVCGLVGVWWLVFVWDVGFVVLFGWFRVANVAVFLFVEGVFWVVWLVGPAGGGVWGVEEEVGRSGLLVGICVVVIVASARLVQ